MSQLFLFLLLCWFVLYPTYCFVVTEFPPPKIKDAKELNTKWNATKADKLKRDLLLNYDKFTRPIQSENATIVYFDPSINHIELEESSGILTIYCWVKMSWTDEKLRWDTSQYGLASLHLADHEIWQPDIIPYNSASGSGIDVFGNTHCIVNNVGEVIWSPPAVFRVFCDLDLRKWPFDKQTCNMKVGSWTYSGMQIDLRFSEEGAEFVNMLQNPEWKFLSMEKTRSIVKYACCNEPYIDLTFQLHIARQSATYEALIVSPVTAIVLMTLTTFWLPSSSRDKLFIGGTTAVIITLFLVYFTQKVSMMAGETPLIVSFYANSLYLVAFSIVISVVVINLATGPKVAPLPWFIKTHLTGWLSRILLLESIVAQTLPLQHSSPRNQNEDESSDYRPFTSEAPDAPEGQEINRSPGSIQQEWRLLATAIDRIFFLFYCFLFICFAIAYSV